MMGDIIKLRKKINKYRRIKNDPLKKTEAEILRSEIIMLIGRIRSGSDRRYEHYCSRILEEVTV